MQMNGSGGHAEMLAGHAASSPGSPDLIPVWLGLLAVVALLAVAISHLRHLLETCGERRSWHLCHVFMAVGMAAMYVPASIDPGLVPAELWRLLFVAAATLAAGRWIAGLLGAMNQNNLWALTALDLGAMAYMWSPASFASPLTWALVGYLALEAGLWGFSAHRVVDGGRSGLGLRLVAALPDGDTAQIADSGARSLVGGLDISLSMSVMTLAMAYMLVAMQLIGPA